MSRKIIILISSVQDHAVKGSSIYSKCRRIFVNKRKQITHFKAVYVCRFSAPVAGGMGDGVTAFYQLMGEEVRNID